MKKKGFTLIELLIVMAIVALLSAISLFALQGARKSARDARRKSDLETIRSAIELYKSDCDIYPTGGGDFHDLFGDELTGNEGGCGGSASRVYLTAVPEDPQGTNDYRYNRITDFTYELCTILEEVPASVQSCSGGYGNYKVRNP